MMLDDEGSPSKAIPLQAIISSRLDRVVRELYKTREFRSKDKRFKDVLARANSLEHRWQKRFKEKWFELDVRRIDYMMQQGALRGMKLNQGDRSDHGLWIINGRVQGGDREGSLGFKPGKYVPCGYT